MHQIGALIDEVLSRVGDTKMYASVAARVEELCKRFPLYPDLQAL
jgi:glycine/serine hydroxymethyltransferase